MTSLNLLRSSDFPGFFTIKNFFIMIDGVYNGNFILRAEDKSVIRN